MSTNIWKGSISFGLLNIGVALKSAQEDKSISFAMLDGKDHSRIKFQRVNAETGREVPYKRIVKGYEYKKGQFVVLTDKDFEAANPKATQTLDIEDFVSLEEIDPLLFDKPYYVVPQKGNEKSYVLLRDVLAKTKSVAVGKMVMHTKQHLGMIMARGDYLVLEMLRFSHEVREVSEVDYFEDVDLNKKYTPKEFEMAKALVSGMSSSWEPEKYKDTYYDDLMKIIDKKVKEGDDYEIEAPKKEKTVAASNVVDLLPLLKQSLASTKAVSTKRKATKSHSPTSRSHH
jgi:DNA end-binding protein Ku